MKKKIILSSILALGVLGGVVGLAHGPINVNAATPEILYLSPNSNWKQANARFAAYFFGNGEKWVSMTDSDGDGKYEVATPAGYPSVIFCRMNPGTTANNWNNKWNQTGDLTIPTDGKNLFTVKDGTWDGATTTWGTYTPVVEKFDLTLYYYNTEGWDNVNLYAWVGESGGTDAATWPGKQMTKESNTDWYSITIKTEDLNNTNIIFNDNAGKQTTDLKAIDKSKPYFYGDGTIQYSSKDEVESHLNYTLPNLFDRYTHGGVYTKKTEIKLNENAANEVKQYFHGEVDYKRTTYFTDTALLMCDYNGNILNEKGHINSGYGTVTEDNLSTIQAQFPSANVGDMTHFKFVDGKAKYDYIVKNSHKNWDDPIVAGMEGFYTTARDFATESYFDSSWELDGKTFTHNVNVQDEKSLSYLKDFVDVAAPCLKDTAISNYLNFTQLTVTEDGDSLVIKLILDPTSAKGKLIDGANNVLAEAIIEHGHTKTYYFTNSENWTNVHAYLFGDAGNNSWPGATMTSVDKNDQGQDVYSFDVDLSKYHTVIFNNNSTLQTVDIPLSSTSNAYYINGGSGQAFTVGTWIK